MQMSCYSKEMLGVQNVTICQEFISREQHQQQQ